MDPKQITRRWFFEQCGVGLGTAALGQLLCESGFAAQPTHFAPKAKHVIFLFMAGAPSHLELFDNKPQLAKFDGTLPPAELLKGYRAAFINPNSKLLGPKFQFRRYGKSGTELSELLPFTGEDCRRDRDRQIHGHRRVQSRARAAPDEYRHHAVRAAEHGRVGAVRARVGDQRPAGLRRLQFRQQRTERRR